MVHRGVKSPEALTPNAPAQALFLRKAITRLISPPYSTIFYGKNWRDVGLVGNNPTTQHLASCHLAEYKYGNISSLKYS